MILKPYRTISTYVFAKGYCVEFLYANGKRITVRCKGRR